MTRGDYFKLKDIIFSEIERPNSDRHRMEYVKLAIELFLKVGACDCMAYSDDASLNESDREIYRAIYTRSLGALHEKILEHIKEMKSKKPEAAEAATSKEEIIEDKEKESQIGS
jgi:hypothetical protein